MNNSFIRFSAAKAFEALAFVDAPGLATTISPVNSRSPWPCVCLVVEQ
jgi:hypothetical protein